MDKNLLINIICRDIKEVEALFDDFTQKPEISKTIIQIVKNKVKVIFDELDLLENLLGIQDVAEIPITKRQIPIIEETVPQEIFKTQSPERVEDVFEIVPQKEETKETTSKQSENKDITLGEKFLLENQSFYDTLTQKPDISTASKLQARPVKSIKKAIGINDRFYFQRELFDGDSKLFDKIVNQLDEIDNIKSAEEFLHTNFDWDENNEAFKMFMEIVRRKYL